MTYKIEMIKGKLLEFPKEGMTYCSSGGESIRFAPEQIIHIPAICHVPENHAKNPDKN